MKDPSNAQRQRDLALSFDHLGDLEVELKEFAGAKAYFESALNIRSLKIPC